MGECEISFVTSYFDESGKHKEASVVTMCGLVASSKEWQRLQIRWLRELRSAGLSKPFHMADCVGGHDEYEGWNIDKRERLQSRLIDTLVSIDFRAFGASVIRKHYDPLANRLRNRKIRDPWFLAFESAIQEMMHRTKEAGKTDRINFVFDRQDEFRGRAHGLYGMILENGTELGYFNRMGTLAFSPKDNVCALQAADLVVYEANKNVVECRLGGRPERWQMARLRKRPINGVIWDKAGLSELAELRDSCEPELPRLQRVDRPVTP
jgi:hypothetical protein